MSRFHSTKAFLIAAAVAVSSSLVVATPAMAGGPAISVSPAFQDEGFAALAIIVFTAADFGEADCTPFNVTMDWGDGASSALSFFGLTPNCEFRGTHTYVDEGLFPLTGTVLDANTSVQSQDSNTATIADTDYSLSATGGSVAPSTEGSPTTVSASFTDTTSLGTTASDFTAMIDWGDSTSSAGIISLAGSAGAFTFTVSGSHTYAEEGSFTPKVTLADDGSGTATATANLTANVVDAALTGTAAALTESPTIPFTATVAHLSDADPYGAAGDYSATISWGDVSAPSAGTVAANPGGGFDVAGTHTYAAIGSYSVTVTMSDAGGSFATVQSTITVTEADLGISIGAAPNPVKTGSNLTYTITVKNGGPNTSSGLVVSDSLSAASQFQSIAAPGWTCLTPAVGASGVATCSRTSLANVASSTIQIVVQVVAPGKSNVSNTASLSSTTFDPNLTNNSATATTAVFGRR